MKTVYIIQEGAMLKREGGILLLFSGRRKISELSLTDVDQLVLMGNIVPTPSALDLILEKGVDTVFLTLRGRYRGRIIKGLSGNIKLRQAQYKKLNNPEIITKLSKAIVTGKILNMKTFIMRFIRRNGTTEKLERVIKSIKASLLKLEMVDSVDQVRGCEGACSAYYFSSFGELIQKSGFYFDGRNKRPPVDPVNALLSLGYTFLANAIEAVVNIVGLDPYIGALHAIESARPSLVCDIQEEFRVPIVDSLVVSALNRNMFGQEDFEIIGEGEPVIMKRESLAMFARLFEKKLDNEVMYQPEMKKFTYRQIIEKQVRKMARFFIDHESFYEPFLIR